MTESLPPHENKSKDKNVEPIVDERIDPGELQRYEILEQFLSQCRHPALNGPDKVAEFIVATLNTSLEGEWGSLLQELSIDVFDFEDSYFDDMREEDATFKQIFDLLTRTKADFSDFVSVRKALFELLDLRGGVITQFDKASLMSDRNETAWRDLLNRLVPATAP